MGFGENGYAYIINTEGITVAHKNRDNVMNQFNPIEASATDPALKSAAELFKVILSEKRGIGTYNYNGKDLYSAYADIEGTNWILIQTADKAEVLASLTALTKVILTAAISFLLLGIVFAFILGKSIAKPIKGLSEDILKISNYDLSVNENSSINRYIKRVGYRNPERSRKCR